MPPSFDKSRFVRNILPPIANFSETAKTPQFSKPPSKFSVFELEEIKS